MRERERERERKERRRERERERGKRDEGRERERKERRREREREERETKGERERSVEAKGCYLKGCRLVREIFSRRSRNGVCVEPSGVQCVHTNVAYTTCQPASGTSVSSLVNNNCAACLSDLCNIHAHDALHATHSCFLSEVVNIYTCTQIALGGGGGGGGGEGDRRNAQVQKLKIPISHSLY